MWPTPLGASQLHGPRLSADNEGIATPPPPHAPRQMPARAPEEEEDPGWVIPEWPHLLSEVGVPTPQTAGLAGRIVCITGSLGLVPCCEA